MKLKRLIAFTVVMAVIMSCFCAVSTTVSAAGIKSLANFDGRIYKSDGASYYDLDQHFSNAADTVSEWPEDWKSKIYPNASKSKLSNYALNVTGNGVGLGGSVASVQDDDPERDIVYESSYSELRIDIKNSISAKEAFPTDELPVLVFHYYFKVPESSVDVTKKQRYFIYNYKEPGAGTTEYNNRAYIDFTYSGTDKTLSLSITQFAGRTLLWGEGNDTIAIKPDKWYKVEVRSWVDDEGRLVIGIYYDNEQVSCYRERTATTWGRDKNNIGIHQIYFMGDTTKTSPGLIYYDDIHYGLYPASYKPAADEITLSADKGDVTATIKGYKSITKARLVAALYNGDTFAGVASSDVISGENGIRTITCNFPTGVTYTKYKLFLFDDYGTLKPLAPMVEKPKN